MTEHRRETPDGRATDHDREESADATVETPVQAGDPAEFDDGRYLYCVVADDEATVSTTGINDGEVFPVRVAGLTAFVGRCHSLYDASNPETIRRWLVQHQSVVDAAGEAAGTPLPFRFDTVIVGGDEAVRDWLRENADALADALERFAGRWEYRMEVIWDESRLEERLADGNDPDERDLSEGRAFLEEQRREQQLRERIREYREERARAISDQLESIAGEIERVRRSSAPLVTEADSDGPSVTFAVLTAAEHEETLGEFLESVASPDGVRVRFTGPWPPYTFAPTI